jgi:hypothetical protein
VKFAAGIVGVTMALMCLTSCSSENKESVNQVHWDLNAIADPSTLKISGYIGSSSCSTFESFNVVEDINRVEITVMARSSGADACTADMRIKEIDVSLAAPLGERELTGCLPFESQPGESDLGCRTIVPRINND